MTESRGAKVLTLRVLNCLVRISCPAPGLLDLLAQAYGSMHCNNGVGADLEYLVDGNTERGVRISRAGCAPLLANSDGEFLFLFEKDLTIQLQRLRRDLYFLHAAAVELAGRTSLLVGASGQGKSTTAWGLLHHGFGYLSDELGPVCLRTMRVFAYPHSLCLKSEPPPPYPLPPEVLRTSQTLHVPALSLPGPTVSGSSPIAAVFFLERRTAEQAPMLAAISSGEGTARLFAQALNPLAHREDGLHGAITIAREAYCFRLLLGDLRCTCDLLADTLSRLPADRRSLNTTTCQGASIS